MRTRWYSEIKKAGERNLSFLRLAMAEEKEASRKNRHRPRTGSKVAGLIEFYGRKGRSMPSFRDERTGMRLWKYPVRRKSFPQQHP